MMWSIEAQCLPMALRLPLQTIGTLGTSLWQLQVALRPYTSRKGSGRRVIGRIFSVDTPRAQDWRTPQEAILYVARATSPRPGRTPTLRPTHIAASRTSGYAYIASDTAGSDDVVGTRGRDHGELCAHERDWPFRIMNMLEVVDESMGLHQQDRYKQLKIMQDADQIVSECSDLIAQQSAFGYGCNAAERMDPPPRSLARRSV